ncbi:MAG: C39 family peptidase [Lautropia sp.]|nr:C39 family peptidase [Lautropia sp.]
MKSERVAGALQAGWVMAVLAVSSGSTAEVWANDAPDRQQAKRSRSAEEKGHSGSRVDSSQHQQELSSEKKGQVKDRKEAKKPEIKLPPKRAVPKPGPEAVLLATHSIAGQVPVKSWKTLRDQKIVKQDQDFSCGAASLATLLNQFYGQNTTEEAILKAMAKEDGMASFEDMARVMPGFGFRAQGFAASWEQLTRLKIPVVVYVKHRKDDHFSVLRGIDANTVWLADPSLGNRTYSRAQFLEMWQTREDKKAPALAGKFLAILPAQHEREEGTTKASAQKAGKSIKIAQGYFSKAPRRQSGIAVEQLSVRPGWW